MKREPEQENLGKNSPDDALKTDESKHDQEKVRCGYTTREGSVTALPIVPVEIRRKGTKKYVETYALLDGGSNSTFCTNFLKSTFRMHWKKRKVKLTTFSPTTEDVTTVILDDLEVFDLDKWCRPNIPVSKDEIPIQDDVDRWPYLQGHVFLPNLDSNVEALIGANVPEALQPSGLSVRKMVFHITHGFNALLSKMQGKTRCCQVTKHTWSMLTNCVRGFWTLNEDHLLFQLSKYPSSGFLYG